MWQYLNKTYVLWPTITLVHRLHFVRQYSNFENRILFSSCSVQNFMRFNHGMIIMNLILFENFIYIIYMHYLCWIMNCTTEHKLYISKNKFKLMQLLILFFAIFINFYILFINMKWELIYLVCSIALVFIELTYRMSSKLIISKIKLAKFCTFCWFGHHHWHHFSPWNQYYARE